MRDIVLLNQLRYPSLVFTMKLRFDNISMMKPSMCLSIRDGPKQFQVEPAVTQVS